MKAITPFEQSPVDFSKKKTILYKYKKKQEIKSIQSILKAFFVF